VSHWHKWPARVGPERLDGGFTLVEVLVALVVLALGAAGVVPLLIVGAQAATFAKTNTQAKNLAQQRIERMRDLQFHVERQNGPFVDLLDQYYTDLATSPTVYTIGGETATGQWVSSGTPGAGEPAVPFYRVSIASLSGYTAFSQTVDAQFLSPNGTAAAATLFPTYDSQVEANDAPPTLLLGVTVLTTWTVNGKFHRYSAYTRITQTRVPPPLLTSRASAELLRVTSTSPAAAALSADVATSVADGSLSTGSAASGSTRAGLAQDSANADTQAANWLTVAPDGTATGTPSVSGQTIAGKGSCGWASFGRSDVQGGSASVANGLPRVPADAATGGFISAALDAAGNNNSCGLFSFNNQNGALDPRLQLTAGAPLVSIPDASGNSRAVTGSAWVSASDLITTPHNVTSGAMAANNSGTPVQLFPGLPFVSDHKGLVDVTLTSSSLQCAANVLPGNAQQQTSAAAYSVTVDYWVANNGTGSAGRVSATYSMNGAVDPLVALPPASIVVYQNGSTVLHLSDYVNSWALLRSVSEGATNGVHSLNGIFTAATGPVRGSSDLASSVGVQVGLLSCVADDGR